MKKLLSMIGIALLMTGCTDDYKDWADPITNGPEEALNVGISVSPTSAVDFATYTNETVQLFNASVTGLEIVDGADEGVEAMYSAEITNEDGSRSIPLEVNGNGYVSTTELESAVNNLWGRRPVARTIPVNVVGLVDINGTTIAATGSTTLTATPNAPIIEDAYYITGTVNGWNNSNTDYELSNGGADAYENPVFTVLIPGSVVTGDIEFKVTPKSGLGGDWSKCLTASETEGSFATDNAGGNLKVAYVEGAKFYRIQFDMMNQTWTSTALKFGEFFYEIGNEGGWGISHALYGADGDGKYTGFYYLDGEFKFKPNADNWDDDLEYVDGTTTNGTLTSSGGPNCPDPGAGFYKIDLDAASLSYNLTKIESVSLIGGFNDWSGDVEMTYNTADGCWEVTTDAVSGEFKFRANHDWGINWGGDVNALTQDGANLNITAGTHTFKLYLSYNGAHKVTIK
ncbi:protein of unknown function [Prevotella sp. khp7]|uniref:Outer membrane protein SusF domain-containing protein n=1 Tax=Prevotella sp. khp7 TaxID=1761885 RepID=UPI0008D75FA7|nr:DUF5115 domain-containing protein [Prevotella sp. khp7]SEW00580.1 protein of unknown function [Prevotella sp. khp7]